MAILHTDNALGNEKKQKTKKISRNWVCGVRTIQNMMFLQTRPYNKILLFSLASYSNW